MEMIRKDWKKQQQKERQARSQSSPPTKDQTKSKSTQGSQRSIRTNREQKGSNPLGIKLSALPRPWGLNSHWERC